MLRLPEFLAMLLTHLPFVENVVIVSVYILANEVTIRLNRSVPTEIVRWNLLNIKESLE